MYDALEKTSERLAAGLASAAEGAGIPARVERVGSLLTLFFTSRPPVDWDSASLSDPRRYAAYFRRMLDRGIYLPPSQYEALFVSLAHTVDQIDRTVSTAAEALKGMRWGPEV